MVNTSLVNCNVVEDFTPNLVIRRTICEQAPNLVNIDRNKYTKTKIYFVIIYFHRCDLLGLTKERHLKS